MSTRSTALRVVSLLPSATENVCALLSACQGHASTSESSVPLPELVGRSHECDFPRDALDLPVLTAARTAFTSSVDTHKQVREALASAASLYHLDADKLAALQPDVILTQSTCKVCSIDLASVQQAVHDDVHRRTTVDQSVQSNTVSSQPAKQKELTKIVTCNPTSLVDALGTQFRQLGDALGVPQVGESMAQEHLDKLQQLEHQAAAFVDKGDKPNVLMVEWLDPLFLGTKGWMREIVEAAGGQIVDTLERGQNVDVVVVALCGLTLDKTEQELVEGRVGDWWETLLDQSDAIVYIVDGTSMFTRPTRRLLVALEWLVHALHEPGSIWLKNSTFPYKLFDTSLVTSGPKAKEKKSAEMLEIEELHRAACSNQQDMYTDPATGYSVMTAYILKERQQKPMPRVVLLTTIDPKTNVVPIQNISSQTIAAQAEALELPLCLVAVGLGDEYTSALRSALVEIPEQLKRTKKSKKAPPIEGTCTVSSLVFGDLHLEDIRTWREETFGKDYKLLFPVWKKKYESELLPALERICAKTGAKIFFSNVDEERLASSGARWEVGQVYDWKLIQERNKATIEQVDLMGECDVYWYEQRNDNAVEVIMSSGKRHTDEATDCTIEPAHFQTQPQLHKASSKDCDLILVAVSTMSSLEKSSDETVYQRVETPRTTTVDVNEPVKTSSPKKNSTASESGSSKSNLRNEVVHDGPTSFKISHLYRYATTFDKVLLTIGVITTGANGALFPLMAIVFGNALSGFAATPVDMDAVNLAALNYLYIAIFMFATDYISYVAFYYSAERQMKALRSEALKHMLYLDTGWYDANDALKLSSRLTGDRVRIKDGMGHNLGDAFRYTIQFFVGLMIGFTRGWDITLVMASVMPIMAISLSWLIKTFTLMSEFAQKVYAVAGSVAEETLSSIRTVASLNG
ncbi:hypothetical protein JG688_00016887, partial [Phytophthora aleatoria]